MSVVTRVVSASARPLCAGVVLSISLMCAALGVAASTPPMTGMTEMGRASAGSDMNGMSEVTVAAAVAPVAAAMTAEVGVDGGLTLASMCESPCAADIGGACTVAAGLAVTALLALFLASRRDTFLGLLARLSRLFFVLRPCQEPTPWTVLSLTTLCVLRSDSSLRASSLSRPLRVP
jgi:hypothetical protein